MFDDITISESVINKFKEGARQYPKLEFSNISTDGGVVDGRTVIDNGKNLNELITEHVRLDGISVEFASITGNTFELGTMCAGAVTLELVRDGLDAYYFENATVKVSIGVIVDGPEPEYVKFGVYRIDEVKKTKHGISLIGLDYMMKFNKTCVNGTDAEGNPTFIIHEGDTISEAAKSICRSCGVDFKDSDFDNLTNCGYVIENIPSDIETMNCRQILSQLTALMGGCGRMDANGYFRITPYVREETTIGEGDRYESEISEKAVKLTGVKLINANGDAHLSGNEGYVLELPQNDFIVSGTVEMADNIWTLLKQHSEPTYLPYLVTTLSLPHLRPLNVISITDATGETHSTIITNYLFRLNNSTKIEAKGIGTVRKNYGKLNDFTRNQSRIISKTEKAVDEINNTAVRSLQEFNETLISAMGVYRTEMDNKLYFHDQTTLATSKNVFTMTSEGIGWTDNWQGNDTVWRYGVRATGEAFFKRLIAGGIEVGGFSDSDYNISITPEKFAIEYNDTENIKTITRIEKGSMTIPRLEIESQLDFGPLRVVPCANGIDIIYTK